MDNKHGILMDELPDQAVFALDIGTRSIIGMVGIPDGDRIHIVAIERAEHTKRAMIDGQIEDIGQVSKVARQVKERLEKKLGCRLNKVSVAAAGRSLKTQNVTYEMELSRPQKIDKELVGRLEAGAINEAEKLFMGSSEWEPDRQFYLVGYTVSRYYLDNYGISSLVDHHGKHLKADVIATFLPTEVVESLYVAMGKADLEVESITLEPIAAINAAIPQNLRLLNLAMVDIGAGTSDIAVCRDGSITGYTMAILAGDEITESIMKEYLVDFDTAERIKAEINEAEKIQYYDILGFEQTATREAIFECIKGATIRLCQEIAEKILEVNGGMPSAVFLAGGGSQLSGLKERIVEGLNIDPKRVALAGKNFKINAFSDEYDLDNPEYATPLGIVISTGLHIVNHNLRVFLNGKPAKLFRSGNITVMDVLMMNGYKYQDMLGRSGQNLAVTVNGKRIVVYGEKAEPSVLTLNGANALLSDSVRMEDQIVFVPVKNGKSASIMLSRVAELGTGKKVLLNGRGVAQDVALKPGDMIVTGDAAAETEDEGQAGIAGRAETVGQMGVAGRAGAVKQTETVAQAETVRYAGTAGRVGTMGQAETAEQTGIVDQVETVGQTGVAGRAGTVRQAETVRQTGVAGRAGTVGQTGVAGRARAVRHTEIEGLAEAVDKSEAADKVGDKVVEGQGQLSLNLSPLPPPAPWSVNPKQEKTTRARRAVAVKKSAETGEDLGEEDAIEPENGREKSSAADRLANQPRVIAASHATKSEITVESDTSMEPDASMEPGTPMEPDTSMEPEVARPKKSKKTRKKSVKTDRILLDEEQEGSFDVSLSPLSFTHSPVPQTESEIAVTAMGADTPVYTREITIYLNDIPRTFPAKPTHQPYYLMDMLEHSGLDFKNLNKEVILKVNGKEGFFQQELHHRDRIIIRQVD